MRDVLRAEKRLEQMLSFLDCRTASRCVPAFDGPSSFASRTLAAESMGKIGPIIQQRRCVGFRGGRELWRCNGPLWCKRAAMSAVASSHAHPPHDKTLTHKSPAYAHAYAATTHACDPFIYRLVAPEKSEEQNDPNIRSLPTCTCKAYRSRVHHGHYSPSTRHKIVLPDSASHNQHASPCATYKGSSPRMFSHHPQITVVYVPDACPACCAASRDAHALTVK